MSDIAEERTTLDEQVTREVDRAIDDGLDRWLDRLGTLVSQPSISSQGIGMRETAEMVAEMLEGIGFETRILPTPRYPVVYAEAAGRTDRTLICYNHYDVQPAEPLELWDSPPFQATLRDGKMFGRGVADDKGHIISRLAAIEAVHSVTGRLPCRIKFMIEGGEEISSPHVPEFVEEHRDLLAADGCVWETGGVGFDGRPNIMLGMRGICYVEYRVRTMNRDAHSGSAHLLPNAAWRLVRALTTIKDENERILIEGFYDDVEELSDVDRRILEEMHDEHDRMRQSYGIGSFNLGLDGFEAKKAVFSPTANIAGLSAGYEGEGPKTVIPAYAMAKMDFRLVPDQDPEDIVRKLRRHLDRHGYEDVQVEYLGGERAARTPPDEPLVQLAVRTAEGVYGKPANINPLVGGSGPVYPFRHYLGVPIVPVGVADPESLAHAPNENITIENFVLGTRHMARILLGFPSL